MTAAKGMLRTYGGLGLRAALPCAILVAGWWGYTQLAVEVAEEPVPETEERILRTRVVELEAGDYPVVITTHGTVQAHNQVTLAAEVTGPVTRVSPSFESGAFFSKGDILVEIDPRNYEAAVAMAESRLLAAQSALDLARLNEARKLRLIESDAVSKAEVDSASASREQAEADVSLAAAQLGQAQLDLKRTKLTAPFDGRVETKNIGLGQMVNPTTPLGTIFAVDFAEVRLPVSAYQRQFVSLPEYDDDPPVEVVLRDALRESSSARWPAKIVRTEGVLDADSRDLFAIARIDDPFRRDSSGPPLRIGQPVTAAIDGIVLHDVVALPRQAVRQLNKIVLVDPNERTLAPLSIESVWSDAEHVVVKSNEVPPDMWLATTPLVYTPTGAPVEIIPEPTPETAVADSTSPVIENSSDSQ